MSKPRTQAEMKDIPGYEGIYAISPDGKVWSYPRKRLPSHSRSWHQGIWLKPVYREGYPCVDLTKNGKINRKSVHRLVAQCFIENPFNLPQVNHKDGDRKNPNVQNLEWCTPSYNIRHGISINGYIVTKARRIAAVRFGRKNRKFHSLDVRLIRLHLLSAKETAPLYHVTAKTVRHIRARDSYKEIQ